MTPPEPILVYLIPMVKIPLFQLGDHEHPFRDAHRGMRKSISYKDVYFQGRHAVSQHNSNRSPGDRSPLSPPTYHFVCSLQVKSLTATQHMMDLRSKTVLLVVPANFASVRLQVSLLQVDRGWPSERWFSAAEDASFDAASPSDKESI